jgi:putative FmdB family regulatory protein
LGQFVSQIFGTVEVEGITEAGTHDCELCCYSGLHGAEVELLCGWRIAMSTYVFLCQDCSKEFTQTLHMADVEKGGVVCPHCGGKRVVQEVAAFSAVTSRKS